MRIETATCPACASARQKKIGIFLAGKLVGHERHCEDCERIWHTSLGLTEPPEARP